MGRVFDNEDFGDLGEPEEYEPGSHIIKPWHVELAQIVDTQRYEPHSPSLARIFTSVLIHGLTPDEYEQGRRCEQLLAAND